MSALRPGLILDRDGVINVDTGYLYRIEGCRFVDGIFDLVTAARACGFAVAVATNQSGIGRGYYTEADFQALTQWMQEMFLQHTGAALDAVYFCPDHPEGQGVYRRESFNRKPAPGMFLQAIADLGLDPARSWAVGDNPRDLEAAEAAGVAHRILLDESGTSSEGAGYRVVQRLSEITAMLQPD